MSPAQIGLALVALVAFATALGFVWRWQNGRSRATSGKDTLAASDLGTPLGRDATLVQFSSAVCAPCRSTHAVLAAVAEGTGVTHVDLDIVAHEPLTRRFNILQTPTTLILDSSGVVRVRIGGVATFADVHARLAAINS